MNEFEILPVIPLRDVVVFPQMMIPLFVGRERSIKALEMAFSKDRRLWLVAQKQAQINDPSPNDVYDVGAIGRIVQLMRLPDGTMRVLIEGKKRARLLQFVESGDKLVAQVAPLDEIPATTYQPNDVESLRRQVYSVLENYLDYQKKIPRDILKPLKMAQEPGQVADLIPVAVNFKLEYKQELLETTDPVARLSKVLNLLKNEIENMQAEKRQKTVQQRTRPAEAQRPENQPASLEDDYRAEMKELETQIEKKGMSEEAKEKATRELKRLKMMSPMSAEAAVSRNYIDWLVGIPWNEQTADVEDINEASRVLEEDHYGLKKVKERILEYLAVRMLSGELKGPILCFVGPPGVGKTSIASSIARATGRKFVRMSLGGVRDEAEIRGHRRTYIGSMPGKIIMHMKKAGTINPVLLLDEIDKLSSDFRGDPASALLEALDPEQNNKFQDHFLDVDYDLSKVLFITTANYLNAIPAPLRDRLEIIELNGYSEDEKMEIARRYLIPKQIKANGLDKIKVAFEDEALKEIINSYTREAGVRSLERAIATVDRKIAVEALRQSGGTEREWTVNKELVRLHLGVPKYQRTDSEKENLVGVANGMAWTEFGGELLNIEVVIVPGDGKLTITGKLGEVMQESAKAALMYIRSRANRLGISSKIFKKTDIHIHVPEGAVPKDGPSAGITIATAIASALTGIPVRRDVSMTGELTLRGRVLAIGGLKEKFLAAHRSGIKTVVIPKENEPNLEDVPEEAKKDMQILCVADLDDALKAALISDPFVEKSAIIKEDPLKDDEDEEKNKTAAVGPRVN